MTHRGIWQVWCLCPGSGTGRLSHTMARKPLVLDTTRTRRPYSATSFSRSGRVLNCTFGAPPGSVSANWLDDGSGYGYKW